MAVAARCVVALALLAGCPRATDAPDATVARDAMETGVDAVGERPHDTAAPFQPRFVPWETGMAPATCNDRGWCWENPVPAGGHIAAMGAKGNDGWALTREGLLLHASPAGLRAVRVHPYDPTRTGGSIAVLGPDAVWVAVPGAMLRWDGRGFERAVFYDDTSEPSLVWGRAPDDLWVAGPVGTALHFDGRTWDTRPLPTSADVVSLAGGGDAEVWAQDASGVVWRWRGGAWARGETRPVDEHRGLWIMGPDDAWACGDGVASHWDGARWTREVVDRMPSSRLCAVWSDGDAVWFSDGTFVRRRNRDAQWDFESESSQVTAVGGAPDDVWLGRQDGVIQRISEGRFVGVTRTRPRFDVTRLAGTDDATLRALTPATLMSFDGRAWFEASAPPRFYELHGAFPLDATDTWLAGLTRAGTRDGGRAARWSRDAGERDVLETEAPLRAVAGSGRDDVWAVGDGGAAWRWDGARWAQTETGVTTALRDVWARSRDDAWAVGDGATALHWDGARWQRTALPMAVELTRVHGRAADDVWAIGRDARGSWVFRWDGAQWRRDTAGLPAGYAARGVWAAPDGRVWLAGTSVLRRENNVWNAEPAGTEATLQAVGGARDGAVRVAGSTATILVRRP